MAKQVYNGHVHCSGSLCVKSQITIDISLGEVVRKRNRDSKKETDTESEVEEREGDVNKKNE